MTNIYQGEYMLQRKILKYIALKNFINDKGETGKKQIWNSWDIAK